MKKLIIISTTLLAMTPFMANAKRIVIGADSKIFETPIAKDEYCAVNDSDEPVILVKGMAFNVIEEKAGWYMVEYSPGLRGMVMTNIVADPKTIAAPAPGSYEVKNNPKEKITVSKDADVYVLNSAKKTFKGNMEDNVIIFKNPEGTNAYSITIQEGKPMVFNYSNEITKFF